MPRSRVKRASWSTSRPMTRQYRKELEAAATLLALPGDVAELLLDYVASEPQAILNLRQVCTTTKGWVDFMRPSQAKRIFSRIPIHIDLNKNDVEKFEKFPPPPLASALKLQEIYCCEPNRDLKSWELLKSKKTTFPAFFGFWESQMSTLIVNTYSTALLETLGTPKALRNLTSTWDTGETHPSLLQLETVTYHHCEPSVDFFRDMASSQSLKRLSVVSCNSQKTARLIELVQIVIDAKRNAINFQLDLYVRCWDFENKEDEVRTFLASFAASASSIRLFGVSNKLAEQVLRLRIKDDRDGATRRFFESIQSMDHEGELENSCFFLEQSMFRNLKKLSMVIPEGNEARLAVMQFPSGINKLTLALASGSSSVVVPRHLPVSLRSLVLHSMNSISESDHPISEIELVESLSLISRSCPFLEELVIETKIPSSGYSPNIRGEHSYSFTKLKSLKFFGQIVGECDQEKGDGRRLMESLLFDILHINEMSLREFSMKCEDRYWCLAGIGLQLDSGCVERLLSSPSANSLLYLCLECRVIEEAKESFKKLKAMVEENKRKYRERYGREQTKVLCDCFEF